MGSRSTAMRKKKRKTRASMREAQAFLQHDGCSVFSYFVLNEPDTGIFSVYGSVLYYVLVEDEDMFDAVRAYLTEIGQSFDTEEEGLAATIKRLAELSRER